MLALSAFGALFSHFKKINEEVARRPLGANSDSSYKVSPQGIGTYREVTKHDIFKMTTGEYWET